MNRNQHYKLDTSTQNSSEKFYTPGASIRKKKNISIS